MHVGKYMLGNTCWEGPSPLQPFDHNPVPSSLVLGGELGQKGEGEKGRGEKKKIHLRANKRRNEEKRALGLKLHLSIPSHHFFSSKICLPQWHFPASTFDTFMLQWLSCLKDTPLHWWHIGCLNSTTSFPPQPVISRVTWTFLLHLDIFATYIEALGIHFQIRSAYGLRTFGFLK